MTDANKSDTEIAEVIEQDLTDKITKLRADSDIMTETDNITDSVEPAAASGDNDAQENNVTAKEIDEVEKQADSENSDSAAASKAKQQPKMVAGKRVRWYIVHAYSGFEKKIANQIKERAIQNNIADQIQEVVVPTQDVLEVRRGKKVVSEKKFFPGYLLIKMALTDESWHMVRNIDKVTGFLGQGGRPQPVPQSEVDAIFQQIEAGVEAAGSGIIYVIGENVKITDGPFESFTGVIEDVDEEREKVQVSVAIFGRATPVELDYTQVEKI